MCLSVECARDSVYETERTRRRARYSFTRGLFSQVFPIRFFLQCSCWYKGNSLDACVNSRFLFRIYRSMSIRSKRARAVKGFDSKSNGLSPRRFESCRLRRFAGRSVTPSRRPFTPPFTSESFLPLLRIMSQLLPMTARKGARARIAHYEDCTRIRSRVRSSGGSGWVPPRAPSWRLSPLASALGRCRP